MIEFKVSNTPINTVNNTVTVPPSNTEKVNLDEIKDAITTPTLEILVIIFTAIYLTTIQNFKSKLNKLFEKSSLKINDVDKQNTIYYNMGKLTLKTHCDRLLIAQFHNGLKFTTGSSFMKFSVTFETSNAGLSSLSSKFQSIPVTILGPYLEKLFNGEVSILDKQVVKKSIFVEYGVDKVVLYPILNEKQLIAFLIFNYTNDDYILEESIFNSTNIASYTEEITKNLI